MIDFFIKLGLYVALGILLVLANIWYLRSLVFTFFTAQTPKSIAPFDLVGKEHKEKNRDRQIILIEEFLLSQFPADPGYN